VWQAPGSVAQTVGTASAAHFPERHTARSGAQASASGAGQSESTAHLSVGGLGSAGVKHAAAASDRVETASSPVRISDLLKQVVNDHGQATPMPRTS
jgi:hypothetical protein